MSAMATVDTANASLMPPISPSAGVAAPMSAKSDALMRPPPIWRIVLVMAVPCVMRRSGRTLHAHVCMFCNTKPLPKLRREKASTE